MNMSYRNLEGRLPKTAEKIAVDTQIIYWVFYADDNFLIEEKPRQISEYSSYIKKLLGNGNKIVVFGGVLLELFKIIEINEYKIYLDLNGKKEDELKLKDYREIKKERELVKQKLDIAYKQLKQFGELVYDPIDSETYKKFIESFDCHKSDFVDFALLKFCEKNDISYILTDDKDFKTIPSDITIISDNRAYIS